MLKCIRKTACLLSPLREYFHNSCSVLYDATYGLSSSFFTQPIMLPQFLHEPVILLVRYVQNALLWNTFMFFQ